MSTHEPEIEYGTTGERLKALVLSQDARDRAAALAARYWEVAAYAVIALSAAILRFWNLGARAMHHDESLHGYFAYGFTKGLRQFFTFNSPNVDTYEHVPFMHGPFQFIGNGFVMWIFGDGEYQSRMLAAAMGTAMVVMPFLLRRQLGTFGALAASAFIAFSPTLTYYSRFTREDIYTAFWTLGMVVFMWRYLASRQERFLYLTAAFMAGAFLTKETTFMTVGAFLVFLDFMFATHLAGRVRAKSPMTDLQHAVLVIALTPIAWIAALAWPFIEDLRDRYDLDEMPAEASLLLVMGTLALPLYAAMIQLLPFGFGETWRNRAGENGDLHIASQERGVAYTTVFVLIGLSATLGALWNARTWLLAAASFWVPYFLLSVTFFSNVEGFFSVIWGSMDYWISQQDVRRGNQPDYYYFITIPVYEFVPLALALAAGLYYAIRGQARNAMIVGAGMLLILFFLLVDSSGPRPEKISLFHGWIPFLIVLLGVFTFRMDMLTRFLLFWTVLTALALTVAGEKMPWLNVHIALPLAILAGRFVGDLLSSTDLREDIPKVERLAPFAYTAVASALAIVVFVIVGPLSLASFGGWVLATVAAVSVYWAFTGYSRRTAMQVALVGAIAAFSVFSLRATVLASWGHPDIREAQYSPGLSQDDHGDVPIELLVYTQTSGDIPVLRNLIDDYAKQSGLGYAQPIVVDADDGFTWPWAWYLRHYRDVNYASISQGFTPKAGSVLLIADKNASNLNLGGAYNEGIRYHHRRWFPEDYRGAGGVYDSRDFFRDLFDPDALGKWIDFWVRRSPPSALGTVDGIAFFPKDFGGVPQQPVGPTVRQDGTQLVIGGNGSAPGQMNGPSDVAFDASGNIYVADTNNNRLEKYDAEGNFIVAAGGFGSTEFSLNLPSSLAVALDGTVFVADTWNHRILKLDKDLKLVDQWGTPAQTETGGDPFGLFGPREIVLRTNGNVLIADTGNGRLVEYTQDGDFVAQWGGKGKSGAPLEFDEPVGIVITPDGDLYVADFWNRRILRFDGELKLKSEIKVDSWGSQAVTDRPYLALLPDGRLLATDPANGKVLIFGADGSSLGSYELPKEGAQTAARPIGIASDGTSVLVADSIGNVVRKIPLSEVTR